MANFFSLYLQDVWFYDNKKLLEFITVKNLTASK